MTDTIDAARAVDPTTPIAATPVATTPIATTAAVVHERGGPAVLTGITLPAPGDDEVLVRIRASGVCPTDLFGIAGGAGDRFPAVFGHEGAGVVEAVGRRVGGIHPGDHVVLSFASCQTCAACADGHPAYCARFSALNYGARGGAADGGGRVTTGWMSQSSWAEHVVAPASSVAVIGHDVPWQVAAPLGCGILTGAGTVLNTLRPGTGDALLVLGAGTTGLAAVMAARHRGVARVAVSDPVDARRVLAREVGATETHDPAALDGVTGFTHAIDTVGSQGTTDAVLAALAPRGVAATVALKPGANPVTVSQSRLLWGRTLTGVIEGDAVVARDVPLLAALWRAGRLPVERLVTAYDFADVGAAIDAVRSGRAIKPVLLMDRNAAGPGPAASSRSSATLLEALRAGDVPDADLPALWRSLPPVAPGELRGLWHGWGVTRDHRAGRLLERSRWYGKLFRADDDVAPIVCETDDGLVVDRALARGGATLRTLEHDGVTTAAMVYDGQAIVDLFVRLAPDAVLGVMTGRDAADRGRAYFFVLEPSGDPRAAGIA
ncbi:alcohol dehydrogenase catalytic domain-containing protein [Microbacterium kyungheense]|uniref:Zn-dependent alcohol dehydrogenase n=1 Tax=Microbacterium kyungheense TaxID=1263636 RepID=A0A543EQ48_9MICO|nr:alcohol dehydrogenase catalytic domain-containing protein [Microbacterium kyungheense]TQM23714.1 Zn-dependent alcohol dehydrogenase [Microbacterium kyungheense]